MTDQRICACRVALLLLAGIGLAACSKGSGNTIVAPPNQPPTANAGVDQTINEQTAATLAGVGTDPDGTIATFAWGQTSGTLVTLTGAATATATFSSPSISVAENLVFSLMVTDNSGATGTDQITVTVNPVIGLNDTPVANAGPDQTVGELLNVTLDGSQSNDPDGSITTFAWVQTVGPAVTLTNAGAASANFQSLDVTAPTALGFDLTVTDNEGATNTDSVMITVVEAPAMVTISGLATFEKVPHNASFIGLDYNNSFAAPIRGASVEARDGSTVVATTTTDANGDYSVQVASLTNIVIRVRAEMMQTGTPSWNFQVVDNTSSKALYVLDSAVQNVQVSDITLAVHAGSGWGGSSYTGTRAAGPFAVLDTVYDSYQLVLGANPNTVFPPLMLNWSILNQPVSGDLTLGQIGTSFYNGTEIYLLGDDDTDTDEYDSHVVAHEWGHYYVGVFSRADGFGGPHGSGDILDMRTAFNEGWGNAHSGMTLNDPNYRDTLGAAQASGFTFSVEGNNGLNPGWYSEASVQSIMYDIFDTANDGPDTLAMGFGPLDTVFRGAEAVTTAQTSIFSFITALKNENAGSAGQIDSIVAAQGIVSATMDQYGSTETNNAGSADVLPIYTSLTIGGAAANVCSISSFQTFNGLSVSRFLRFTVTTAATYQFTATGVVGNDPDLILYQGSLLQFSTANSTATGIETFSRALSPGEHVLEVYETSNLGSTPAGRTCFNVQVVQL